MYWDVTTVKPLPGYRIYVEIADGQKGIFDVTPYLDHGMFRAFRDEHYFNQVGILWGAVTWPNDQYISLETLLAEMEPMDSTPVDLSERPVKQPTYRVDWPVSARSWPRFCSFSLPDRTT